MNNKMMVKEIVMIAKSLLSAETFPCPNCGTKVLENTGYCLKCKKKVKKAGHVDINFLVDNYINGNISDVKSELSAMDPLSAIDVAFKMYENMPKNERDSFRKLLGKWS